MGKAEWERRFSFAFVRNPWDRVTSLYFYRVRVNLTSLRTHPVPFNDWVRLVYVENDPRYYDIPQRFMPQLDWVSDPSGEIIVNFMGKFEQLAEDFQVSVRRVHGVLVRAVVAWWARLWPSVMATAVAFGGRLGALEATPRLATVPCVGNVAPL